MVHEFRPSEEFQAEPSSSKRKAGRGRQYGHHPALLFGGPRDGAELEVGIVGRFPETIDDDVVQGYYRLRREGVSTLRDKRGRLLYHWHPEPCP